MSREPLTLRNLNALDDYLERMQAQRPLMLGLDIGMAIMMLGWKGLRLSWDQSAPSEGQRLIAQAIYWTEPTDMPNVPSPEDRRMLGMIHMAAQGMEHLLLDDYDPERPWVKTRTWWNPMALTEKKDAADAQAP